MPPLRSLGARLIVVPAAALVYALVAAASLRLDVYPMVVWPAAGAAFLLVWHFGRPAIPGIFLGAVAVGFDIGRPVPVILVTSAGAALAATLAVGIVRTLDRRHPGAERIDLTWLLIAIPAAAAVASGSSTLSQHFLGSLSGDASRTVFAAHALGYVQGVLLTVPPLLTMRGKRKALRPGRRHLEVALGLFVLTVLMALIFRADRRGEVWLLGPLAAVLTIRGGTAAVLGAGWAATIISAWSTRDGLGPFAATEGVTSLQGFLVLSTATLLLFASITEDRRRAINRLQILGEEDAALRRLATAVASDASLHDIAVLAAREAASLSNVESGVIVRFEDDGARVLGQWPQEGASVATGQLTPIAPGSAVARVRETRLPARFDERGGPLSMAPYTQRVAAPVVADGCLWGALIICSSADETMPAGVEKRLARFSDLVGLAITNADTRAQLLARANTDPLTGLVNHRSFQELLTAEVARAERDGTPLSVALLDIDRFKEVNDTLGHHIGDAVLVETARRVTAAARRDDVVARIGGDELAVLMPGVGGDDALAATERLRCAIGSVEFPGAGRLTTSAGVCDLEQAGGGQHLLRYADGALYWSKMHGRDAAFRYTPDVVEELSATERAERLERSRALGAMRALARAIDAKDPATTRHSERVADLVTRLAAHAGWPAMRINRLREAALVHDVGKIGVPDAILSKPSKLTAEEYEIVKRHAELGAKIAEDVLDPEQVSWVRGHHEREDGRGYPDGLAGDEISDGAALLALADAWDAMTGARVYSDPMSVEDALAECRRVSGLQFRPAAVEALMRLHAAELRTRREPVLRAA